MFSVIIPTYNSSAKLLRTIDSVLKQSFDQFELIIVDDGSTDDTGTVVNAINDTRVKYCFKDNGGPASARNIGIKSARFKYLCFLDADDTFTENKLLYMKKVITDRPGVDLIFTDATYIDEKNGVTYRFSERQMIYNGQIFKYLIKNNFIVNSTVVVNKDTLQKFGLMLDETQGIKFVEDYDLWLKLAFKKADFFYLNEPLTNYYIHENNYSGNAARTYRSLILIYRKYLLAKPSLIFTICFCFLNLLRLKLNNEKYKNGTE